MRLRGLISIWIFLLPHGAWAACPVTVAVPSDDRWHYPFNFSPGTRPIASCFGSTADPDFDTFNDRDGIFLIAWRTDEVITAGLSLEDYEVLAIRVTLTAAAGTGGIGQLPPADWFVDLTVDPWDRMRYPITDTDPGSPLELFGVGFESPHSAATWTEGSPFDGGDQFFFERRNPFPFVFDGDALVHVEDNVKEQFTPQPWAIGAPQGYNRPQNTPFPVHFDLDMWQSDGRVRGYFQQQLREGRVFVAVTSLYATFKQAPGGFPVFFTKEATSPGAAPPRLLITLASTGDVDGDGWRGLFDYSALADCFGGPGAAPAANGLMDGDECLCAFDFDNDFDVDLVDAREFQRRFNGGF